MSQYGILPQANLDRPRSWSIHRGLDYDQTQSPHYRLAESIFGTPNEPQTLEEAYCN